MDYSPHAADITKAILAFHGHRAEHVFADFVEMSALAICNAVTFGKAREKREARYMQIVGKYKAEEISKFPLMLAKLTMALEERMHDVLRVVFHELSMHNSRIGQFFTPYDICKLMASLTLTNPLEIVEKHGFVKLSEPAAGSGAMVIASVDYLNDTWLNYQQEIHVTAVDVDPMCVHMAYVQFSLLNIPAVVVHGNTLTLEEHAHWYTPAHILGGWDWKLRSRRRAEEAAA